MIKQKTSNLKVHLAWGLLNTPFRMPLTPMQRYLTLKARSVFRKLKTGERLVHGPRDYRCYFFSPENARKRALVVHGWLSRAEHMTNIIRDLYENDIEVVAIDLPAHGRSPGLQVTWKDTVQVLLDVENRYGKFDLAIGHSYGGAMLLTATGIGNLNYSEFSRNFETPKMILLGSPTRAETPVEKLSRFTALNSKEKQSFYERIIRNDNLTPEHLDGLYLQSEYPTETDFLCIHSKNDFVIPHSDSTHFKKLGDRVQLRSKDKLGHLRILNDDSVLEDIRDFIQ